MQPKQPIIKNPKKIKQIISENYNEGEQQLKLGIYNIFTQLVSMMIGAMFYFSETGLEFDLFGYVKRW